PALPDRLAALGCRLDAIGAPPSAALASALLSNPEQAALSLIRFGFGDDAGKLKPIAWEGVGDAVFAAAWRNVVAKRSTWLGRFVADALPCGKRAFLELGSELVAPTEANVGGDERIARGA